MKKFISFVMSAAMVASLVPATAFAKGEVTATAKVIDVLNMTKYDANDGKGPVISEDPSGWVEDVPELQLKITNTNYRGTDADGEKVDVTVSLDGAKFNVDKLGNDLTGTIDDKKAALKELVDILYTKDRGQTYKKGFVASTASPATGDILYNTETETEVAVISRDCAALSGANALDWLLDAAKGGKELTIVAGDAGDEAVFYKEAAAAGTGGVKIINADGSYDTANCANDEAFVAMLKKVHAGTAVFQSDADGTAAMALVTTAADGKIKVTVPDYDDTPTDLNDAAAVTALSVTEANLIDFYTDGNANIKRGDYDDVAVEGVVSPVGGITWEVKEFEDDEITFTFTGRFAVDDIIVIDLCSTLDKTGEGKNATVSVSSPMVDANDLVYVSVKARGITATTKKVGSIAEEEIINLDSDIKISSTVGDFVDGQWFELKLSKGFEFSKVTISDNSDFSAKFVNGNTAYVKYSTTKSLDDDVLKIDKNDIEIESTSAKSGSTCTMTVKALEESVTNVDGDLDGTVVEVGGNKAFKATATVEIMKVVDYKVVLSVDEDKDVPVIYSGVNVDNYGITDDSDHMSLEVTAKESFPGAWSMRKGFNFELPEHVYVTDVKVVDTDNFYREGQKEDVNSDVQVKDLEAAFWNAYQDGKHVNFEFAKRVFDDVDAGLRDKKCAEMTFQLELVADPGFEGDVVLKLTGELVDEQEVVIAKFVKPYEVKAEQNDMKIDYRYTEIPTTITLTEAEKGLWAKNEATFYFYIEKEITFDSDPTFEIDSKSDLEIKDDKTSGGRIQFTIKSESDEAATVTIKDMDLFMKRDIPAGPYDLKIDSTLAQRYEGQTLFAPDQYESATQEAHGGSTIPTDTLANEDGHDDDECSNKHGAAVKADSYVGCVADYSATVKEAFVNVITAGREVDDASFTTKVVVPVGENYIVAGEKQIELDTPAYINAAGYTMLPIRAVATALGISNNNVLWDQPTKTVTILYGQRIITMTQGQKVVYVNGSAIPASAAVENTNSRTFLPMRDLATALGVTDITWDQATRTATLNGNQK